MSAELFIPTDTEIIVRVAFRVRGDEYAQNHSFTERYRVRTPEEMDVAVDQFRDALWDGTLRTLRLIAGAASTVMQPVVETPPPMLVP